MGIRRPGQPEVTVPIHFTSHNVRLMMRANQDTLTPLQRTLAVALVTAEVHNRDVLGVLVNEKVDNSQNFLWQAQLRYVRKFSSITDTEFGLLLARGYSPLLLCLLYGAAMNSRILALYFHITALKSARPTVQGCSSIVYFMRNAHT